MAPRLNTRVDNPFPRPCHPPADAALSPCGQSAGAGACDKSAGAGACDKSARSGAGRGRPLTAAAPGCKKGVRPWPLPLRRGAAHSGKLFERDAGCAMAAAVDGVGTRPRARLSSLRALAPVALLAAACAGDPPLYAEGGARPGRPRPAPETIAADFRALPGWVEDDHDRALPALHHTCRWVAAQPADRALGPHPAAGTTAGWRPICAAARHLPAGDPEAARRFFEEHFTPVTLSAGQDGLFTGYYEVELRGSWTRTDRHTVPVYRMPPRTRHGLPDRARIAAGALKGKGLEILWVDDPVDAFVLEIQGSGRVRMTDGSVVALGYAGQNGRAYYPIGRHLVDRGVVATPEQVSLQLIRGWLKANPGEAQRVMNLNPSYVFFRLSPDLGARGARNMALTAGRSLAVDPGHIPLGVPLWLELTEAPVPGGAIRRLVVAQDTGGAIKGPVRGDLFWGHGPEAEEGAGLMRARGRYTMLAPRTATVTAQRR